MWANTCWSLFGIAITLALAMIGLPPEYVWLQPWFLGTSVFCLAASILCFSWPLWIQSPNPTLLQAQIAAFDRVQQFFGGLDEAGLRSLFDFPNMLRFNILLTSRDLQKNGFPPDYRARLSLRYANVKATPSKVAQVEWIPGKIGVINTSKKFIESRQILADMLAYTVLPIKVQYASRDFDTTIEEDLELIVDVLNYRFSHNQDKFIFSEDQKSIHYGTIVGDYATRFRLLGPRTNNIRQAIRDYLGTR